MAIRSWPLDGATRTNQSKVNFMRSFRFLASTAFACALLAGCSDNKPSQAASSPGPTSTNPSGLAASLATFETSLLMLTPTEAVIPISARTRALTTFAEDPIVDLYEALYERVLATPKSSVEISANPR